MKTLLICTLVTCSISLFAQKMDTLKLYDVNLSRLADGSKVTYTLNEQPTTEAEFFRLLKPRSEAKEICHPCYARFVNENEQLLYEGIYYSDCPGTEAVKVEIETERGKTISQKSNNCRDGEWLFYEDGKLKEKISYKMGKEL